MNQLIAVIVCSCIVLPINSFFFVLFFFSLVTNKNNKIKIVPCVPYVAVEMLGINEWQGLLEDSEFGGSF